MKSLRFFALFIMSICFITSVHGQTGQTFRDYLNLSGPLVFDHASYHLSWTSHPADNFYKQEYIAKGDHVEKFKTMILVDVITEKQEWKTLLVKRF
ncbi:hypothetical protein [Pedobacter sp. NJ-S-72]